MLACLEVWKFGARANVKLHFLREKNLVKTSTDKRSPSMNGLLPDASRTKLPTL